MISLGLSMKDIEHQVPAEVAIWLIAQNKKYPLIDFRIEYLECSELNRNSAKEFSQIWEIKKFGVRSVSFLYSDASWSIRIVGFSDGRGNIVSISEQTTTSLGYKLRAEVSSLPLLNQLRKIDKKSYALPRAYNMVLNSKNCLVPIELDAWMASQNSISGVELQKTISGEKALSGTALLEAVFGKDRVNPRKLLKTRH